ncbi:MAG TPA: mitochondrial fission ELM1 family protein [Rhodanobacteraceae bacterium]
MPTTATDNATSTRECWVVTNGAAGNERQALALAGHMGLPIRTLTVQPRAPWSWLAPRRLRGSRLAFPPALLMPPWPHLVIGCGRAAALYTRMLRLLSSGESRVVQILDPRIDPRHWDLVVAPQHDGLRGPNVLHPLGSLNPIDDDWLAAGRAAWSYFADLPAPRIGVLLGGPRHHAAADPAAARVLADALLARHRREGGSLLLLASRRTTSEVFDLLHRALAGIPGLHWRNEDDGPNPYPGALAWADRLVVTPDSVNMLSEACACGCPVHAQTPADLPPKLARLHAALRERGLLHDLDADITATQPPLRETAAIAAAVRARLHRQ